MKSKYGYGVTMRRILKTFLMDRTRHFIKLVNWLFFREEKEGEKKEKEAKEEMKE